MPALKRGLQLVVPREPLDINTIVTETMSDLNPELVSQSIGYRQELGSSLPIITGFPSLLRDGLAQLIRNSMDSMVDKTRIIRVLTGMQQLAAPELKEIYPPGVGSAGMHPYISVYDTGKGLPERQQRQFFTQLNGDNVRTRNLRTVLEAVRRHEAGIRIRSYEDRVFQVFIYFVGSRGVTGRRIKAQIL